MDCLIVLVLDLGGPHHHHQGMLSSPAQASSSTAACSKELGQFFLSHSLWSSLPVLTTLGPALLFYPESSAGPTVWIAALGQVFCSHAPCPRLALLPAVGGKGWRGWRGIFPLSYAKWHMREGAGEAPLLLQPQAWLTHTFTNQVRY